MLVLLLVDLQCFRNIYVYIYIHIYGIYMYIYMEYIYVECIYTWTIYIWTIYMEYIYNIYTYILSQILSHCRLSQDTEYGSLWCRLIYFTYSVCLFITNALFIPLCFSPLGTISLFSVSMSLFLFEKSVQSSRRSSVVNESD